MGYENSIDLHDYAESRFGLLFVLDSLLCGLIQIVLAIGVLEKKTCIVLHA